MKTNRGDVKEWSGVDWRTSKILSTEQVTDVRGGHLLTMK